MLRKTLAFLRSHRVDLQSRHRRDAADWAAVHRRLTRGRDVRVVLDVGAHQGEMARRYHRVFPDARVYALEPTPVTFQQLRRNLGGQPWVELVNAAAGDHDGQVSFFVSDRDGATSNSVLPFADGPSEEVRVPSVRLDTFCAERSIPRVDCLKLDVEGYELAVLEGARGMLEHQAIDIIFAEARGEPMRPGAATFATLSRFLDEAGYTLFGVYTLQWHDNLLLNWFDTIFISDALFRRYVGREPRHAAVATSTLTAR